MIGCHQLYGHFPEAGIILLELASEVADGFGRFEQCPGGVCSEGYNNLRLNDFKLVLQVAQAVGNFSSWRNVFIVSKGYGDLPLLIERLQEVVDHSEAVA